MGWHPYGPPAQRGDGRTVLRPYDAARTYLSASGFSGCKDGQDGGWIAASAAMTRPRAAVGRGRGGGGGGPFPRWSKTAGGAEPGWQDALGGWWGGRAYSLAPLWSPRAAGGRGLRRRPLRLYQGSPRCAGERAQHVAPLQRWWAHARISVGAGMMRRCLGGSAGRSGCWEWQGRGARLPGAAG